MKSQKLTKKLYITVFLTFISLAIFSCSSPSTATPTPTTPTPKNSKAELTELIISYSGDNYSPNSLTTDMTLSLPVLRPLGDSTAPTLTGITARVSRVTISPKAKYTISNENIDLDNISPITIEVTAEDGSKKNYMLVISISINGGFSLGTYASNSLAILGQGFIDTLMEDTVPIITISDVLADSSFSWKLKDAADNDLTSITTSTSSNTGDISILKSHLSENDRNTIKALADTANPEAALKLELTYTNMPTETVEKTINYSPYKIFTWYDLQAMRLDTAGDYTLQKDVTFPDKGQEGFPTEGFEAVPKDTLPQTAGYQDSDPNANDGFTGSFDGGGHSINNFSIARSTEDYIGLFGAISTNKEIKNFNITHVGIEGRTYVGTIVGDVKSGTITGVGMTAANATATVTGTNYVGGLVAFNFIGTITNVYTNGAVTGSDYVGGLAGRSFVATNIVEGYTTGVITGKKFVGGLIGQLGGSITDLTPKGGLIKGYSTGDISGTADSDGIGGLIGSVLSGTAIGYTTGSITGKNAVGGLVGSTTSDSIVTGYSIGAVHGESFTGGLIGYDQGATIKGYARGDVTRTPAAVTNNKFGLLLGTTVTAGQTFTGYHSGKTGESNLVGITSAAAEGTSGTAISINTNTAESDFAGFSFGTDDGKWTFTNNKWPAININTVKAASEQPIDP